MAELPVEEDRQIVGALLLAAGSGSRFGGDKRLAVLPNGKTVLQQSIEAISPAVDALRVVLRPGDTDVATWLDASGVDYIVAERAPRGMGYSIADAIAWVGEWHSCLIALGDMPFIQTSTVAAVVEAAREYSLVVPSYRGRWGQPVAFHRCYFAALAKLTGDIGARSVIHMHREARHELAVGDSGIIRDIDSPADLPSSED